MSDPEAFDCFWMMWRLAGYATFDAGMLTVTTPWFAIQFGWNAVEAFGTWGFDRWSGIRLLTGHPARWIAHGGEFMFRHTDTTLSWKANARYPYEWAVGLRKRG